MEQFEVGAKSSLKERKGKLENDLALVYTEKEMRRDAGTGTEGQTEWKSNEADR